MVMELLVVAAIFAMSLVWRVQMLADQSQVVVYSLRNHTAISVIDGFNQVLICDEGLLEEPSSIDYSLKGYWAERQLPMNPLCHTFAEDFSDDLVRKRKNLISVHGLLLALWDPIVDCGDVSRVDVDYLMVREKQRPDLQSVVSIYRVGVLLIDGSVPDYLAKEWIRQAKSMNIPYRNLREGAMIV